MSSRPRLCLVGPMLGRTPGYITTQGEILADKLAGAGYEVIAVSERVGRVSRFMDTVMTLTRLRRRIDILIVETYTGLSFALEDVASRLGAYFGHRMIFHLHGGALPEFARQHPQWVSRVLARADSFVAPSAFLARAVARLGHEAAVVPNVIELDEYVYRHRTAVRPRLFWMRSFHPIYNPAMAVRVLAALKEKASHASLVMAGPDKGLAAETRTLARALGVERDVRFVGFLDAASKRREADACDIFLNTNHVDNAPVAVVEACAMGLPVVSTRVGGVPDLLRDGTNALLVDDGDVQAMARAVLRLIDDPPLASRLSANGYAVAQRSSWPSVLPLWERVFTQVMGGEPAAAPPVMV